jgi:hypothetical protein
MLSMRRLWVNLRNPSPPRARRCTKEKLQTKRPRGLGVHGEDSEENLITVCTACDASVHRRSDHERGVPGTAQRKVRSLPQPCVSIRQ